MNCTTNSLSAVSVAAVLAALAGCAADSGCCGDKEKCAQVNASVMSENADSDKTTANTVKAEVNTAVDGGASPEDINSLDRRERYDASVRSISFVGGRVSVRPQFEVPRDVAASTRAMAGFNDAWSMNHKDRAVAYAAEAVRFDPQNADAMFALGRALTQKGKSTEALAAFSSAVDLRPAWGEARTELAMTYWRMDRMGDATAEFKRILEAEPNNGFALERLAVASYYAGDKAAAWQYVDRASAAGHQVPPQLIELLGKRP